MGVSIVIPCLNEEKYIKDCLKSLISNGYPISDLEILVVDGGSKDKTLAIVTTLMEAYPQIKLIKNPKRKTPFALNLGIQHATNKYILIAGAHAIYPRHYIEHLHRLIQKPTIDVVGGSIDTKVQHENAKSKAIKFVLTHRMGVGNSLFRVGVGKLMEVDTVPFGLYKKEIFEVAGLYNEALIRNHDIEFSRRIQQHGFQIWLDPTIRVSYFARDTFLGLFKNNYGNGYWNLRTLYITKRISALSLRHYIPLIFVLSLLVPLILGWLFSPIFYLLTLASFSLYFLMIFFLIVRNLKNYQGLYIFWSFLTLHFSYGLGSLVGLFSILKSRNK